MASSTTQKTVPTTQQALLWVKVSDTDPFKWTTSAPVIQPSALGENQILIENIAVSLNPIDWKMAASNFANVTLPSTTGYDISGRIVGVGKGVTDFKVGDEVFGMVGLNSSNGAFQQYSVADADTFIKKPQVVSHEEAATLGVAFLSAMDGLCQVKIDSSTTIFVPGGSGGVGHFIVQIAEILGAKQVITSASKDDGIKILKEHYKIKEVINHGKENVVDRVLELTQGQGADVVYDATYLESSFAKSTQTVKQGGAWIVLGHFGQPGSPEAKSVEERKATLVHADLSHYSLGPERTQWKKFCQGSLAQGAKWIEEGKLKPYINKTIKLEEVQAALDHLKQGKAGFGKVVVKLSN